MTSVHKFNTVTLKDIPITIAHNVDNRRGIFATGDISGGTTIMKIHSNDIIRGKKEELHKVSNETMTAWKKDLPDMTFPVEWDTDKKDQLSCSPMRILLEQKAQQFIGPPGYVKLRSFIGSRCFFDGKEECIVPYADMLNHSNTPNCDWEFKDRGDLEVFTLCDIKEGEEIFDCYGPKTNYETFLHYGFIQEDNLKYDVIRMIGELPDSIYKKRVDPRYFMKAFEFELMGSYLAGTVEIFSFLRYVRSNEKRCPETLNQYIKQPVDKDNELWCCKMLYNMLQKEVQRRLDNNNKHATEPLAVELLQSEMRVLIHWGEICREAIRVMSMKPKQARKASKQFKNEYLIKVVRKLL